ncbi:MAG: hypothetical protein IJX26_00725, partial [Clostridia bacterium]|nr:hypothetical protein [Clostridia bacterium]
IEKIINSRMPKIFNSGEIHTLFFADNPNVVSYAICPITEAGDVYGSIIIFKELEQVSESSFLLAKTFADFLGKQVG